MKYILKGIFFLLFSLGFWISCTNDEISKVTTKSDKNINENNGTTLLEFRIHDEPFKKSGKTVTELNITVKEINIVKATGEIINCPTKERRLNIIEISKSNPVVLSNVSVPSGTYTQIRLVIKDDSTIVVDGEEFSIKIPSGEQSGVKLNGEFDISGKFFRLDLDFKAEESVIFNKGQGYKMKPVIEISNTNDILGFFRGNINFGNGYGGSECVVELNNDNSMRLKVSDYPDNIVYGNYLYDSVSKQLILSDMKTEIEVRDKLTGKVVRKEKKKLADLQSDVPDPVKLNITEWNPNELITTSVNNIENKLYRVPEFNFSEEKTFTPLEVTIDYTDNSKDGKDIIVEVDFIESGSPTLTTSTTLINAGALVNFNIPDSYIRGNSTQIEVNAYLFDNTSDYTTKFTGIGGNLSRSMVKSYFTETTKNPWQPNKKFTITKGLKNIAEVSFPKRLNIKIEHENWTNNNPVISWDEYPEANNGYLVFLLIKDLQDNPNGDDLDGGENWDIAYYNKVTTTQVTVCSEKILFTPVYNSEFTVSPTINAGDIMRVEIFVLDDSGILNTNEHKGCLFMDSLNIVR